MKRAIIVLALVGFTIVVILLPYVYYSNADQQLENYHKEESYNLNKVDSIDFQKEIEILTDKNSTFIDKPIEDSDEKEKLKAEILSYAEQMTGFEIGGEEKEVVLTRKQVMNNSSYNIYSVDVAFLRVFMSGSYVYHMDAAMDMNQKKIIYLDYYRSDTDFGWVDIQGNLEEYFGDYTKWNYMINYKSSLNVLASSEKNAEQMGDTFDRQIEPEEYEYDISGEIHQRSDSMPEGVKSE